MIKDITLDGAISGGLGKKVGKLATPFVYLKSNAHMRLGILLILALGITSKLVTFPLHQTRTFSTMRYLRNKHLQVSLSCSLEIDNNLKSLLCFSLSSCSINSSKMMEVENRIETFGGQVEELPDELKDRRVSGGSGGNGVILEEDEDSLDSIEGGLEKAQPDGLLPVNGRVIKKVK